MEGEVSLGEGQWGLTQWLAAWVFLGLCHKDSWGRGTSMLPPGILQEHRFCSAPAASSAPLKRLPLGALCSWSPVEEPDKSKVGCFLLHSFLSQAIPWTSFCMSQMFPPLFRFNPFYLSVPPHPSTCLLCSISVWEPGLSRSAKTDLICTWANTIVPMPCHLVPVWKGQRRRRITTSTAKNSKPKEI